MCVHAIPGHILLYLTGIDDIIDCFGRWNFLHTLGNWDPNILKRNAIGSFSRIGVKNHILYETLSAPTFSLLCIEADYNYTFNEGSVDWDLPDGLKHLGRHGSPNANLLGWGSARKSNNGLSTLIHQAGFISTSTFNTININACSINRDLISSVNYRIRGSPASQFGEMPTSKFSSSAQMCFASGDVNDCAVDRHHNIAGKLGYTRSQF